LVAHDGETSVNPSLGSPRIIREIANNVKYKTINGGDRMRDKYINIYNMVGLFVLRRYFTAFHQTKTLQNQIC